MMGNLIIVLGVNAAYVYSITQTLTFVQLATVITAITLFKIFWSVAVVAGSICSLFQQTVNVYVESAYVTMLIAQANSSANVETSGEQERQFLFWVRVYEAVISRGLITISLFNCVVAPCLAVLLVSPACFYYVITSPATVDVSYKFVECEGIYDTLQGFVCVGRSIVTHNASYLPAFSYSYQCSSSLLSYFVDIYLLRYLVTGILLPVFLILIKHLQTRAAKNIVARNGGKWSCLLNKLLFQVTTMMVPPAGRILDPDAVLPQQKEDIDERKSVNSAIAIPTSNPLIVDTAIPTVHEDNVAAAPASPASIFQALWLQSLPPDPQASFIARRFSTLLVGDVAIFITFGSIYPPLAVAICISLLTHIFTAQIMLDRFLSLANSMKLDELKDRLNVYVEALKREATSCGSMIASSVAPTSGLGSIFWSFFLFDIFGDVASKSESPINSIWILFVLPVCVVMIRFMTVAKTCVSVIKPCDYIRWNQSKKAEERQIGRRTEIQKEIESASVIELRPSSMHQR
jgi:hypothetical protein